MKLSQALEQIRRRAEEGSLHKLLPDLLEALRSGAADASFQLGASRIAAAFEHKRQGRAEGETKNVFNIAIAIAVGVPVSKQGDDDREGTHPTRAGKSDHSAVHGEGAPAIATATISPQPDLTVPRTALAQQGEKSEQAEPTVQALQDEPAVEEKSKLKGKRPKA
jgi:hypothetical protein